MHRQLSYNQGGCPNCALRAAVMGLPDVMGVPSPIHSDRSNALGGFSLGLHMCGCCELGISSATRNRAAISVGRPHNLSVLQLLWG